MDQIVNALPLVALGRLTIKIGLAMLTPLHAAHGCEWYALLGTKLSCAPSPRSSGCWVAPCVALGPFILGVTLLGAQGV